MKIVKKASESFVREDAHGGSGGRKLYFDDGEIANVQGMTYGFLPAGAKFELHSHEGLNEIMLVLKGQGLVRDSDGEYTYKEGDIFMFPDGVMHEIENTDSFEHEYVFIRIHQ